MTMIENNVPRTNCELDDAELDRVSGGDDLLKYAIADGAQKGVTEAAGNGSCGNGFIYGVFHGHAD